MFGYQEKISFFYVHLSYAYYLKRHFNISFTKNCVVFLKL
jgi:hypothetical protein